MQLKVIETSRSRGRVQDWVHNVRANRWAYVFISPFYILFTLFGLFPILYSLYLSFHDWNGVRPPTFIGWKNYEYVFGAGGAVFWQAVQNSVIIFLLYVPLMTFLAVLMAVLLNYGYVRFFRFFRTTTFMPYVTSMIAAGFVFQILFATRNGLINLVLGVFGIGPIPWLDTVLGTRVTLAIMLIWAWLGYNMILMLAGLQTIPKDLHDAAKVDGASEQQVLWHITIPLLRPIILFSVVLSTTGTFNLFNEVAALATLTGGTERAILTPMIKIYSDGFRHFEFGRASAEAYVYFMLIAVLTFFQFRYFGNKDQG